MKYEPYILSERYKTIIAFLFQYVKLSFRLKITDIIQFVL